jgi:hypothetical protein
LLSKCQDQYQRQLDELRKALERAQKQRDAAVWDLDTVTKWQTEGEGLFENPHRLGFLFSLGIWWGARPWKREK